MSIDRKIKFQSELDPGFVKELENTMGCEGIRRCIQCGECSAVCPLSIYMDIPPRRVIAMVREGFKEEVLHSFTIWLCASCYACGVQCPEKIRIPDVMYALKRRAIENKALPKKFPIPILSREFFKMVINNGRNSEFRLVIRTWIKVSIARMIAMAPIGLDLFKTGRMSFKRERIKNRKDIKVIMESMRA